MQIWDWHNSVIQDDREGQIKRKREERVGGGGGREKIEEKTVGV